MKISLIVTTALLLSSCNTNTPISQHPTYPNVHPGNTQWAMNNGSWAEYDFDSYTGTADPVTGMITVDSASVKVLQQERQTNLLYHMPLDATQIAVARVQTNAGVAATSVDPALAYTLVERQSATVIGEAANPGAALQDPPEAYITISPVVGEVVNTDSLITKFDGTTFHFQTRYQTIAMGVTYDGFPNATVTTLIEQPGPGEGLYVWVFSGGEIAEEVIGTLNADNTVANGGMIRRISLGQNP